MSKSKHKNLAVVPAAVVPAAAVVPLEAEAVVPAEAEAVVPAEAEAVVPGKNKKMNISKLLKGFRFKNKSNY